MALLSRTGCCVKECVFNLNHFYFLCVGVGFVLFCLVVVIVVLNRKREKGI